MELLWNDGLGQADAIQRRSISAVELITACLAHIESINPSINAIVQLDAERALARARDVDADIAAGRSPGPFAGAPFTVKDNMETDGIVTAIGVPERRDTVPVRDATVVHRMKAAGAILIGKTNCPPWGGGLETDNPLYGRTNNPFDLGRTPGGSSGGEAAAITSGMSALGLGSDSGGSLRYPAHFCGIAAIKPASGIVPVTGALDDVGQFGALRDPRTQVGPMARSVRDVARMLQIIRGPDGIDPALIPCTSEAREYGRLADLRVAVQLSNGEVDPSMETVFTVQEAARALSECGATVNRAELPDEGLALTREIWRSYGDGMTSRELYALLAEWDDYRSRMLEWFQDYDAIIRPVSAAPADLHGETDPATLYTAPFSLTGWPAAVVRCGASNEGLPIGAQIATRPWNDRLALDIALALERMTGGWRRPQLA